MRQERFVPNVLCDLQVREDGNGQQSRVVGGRAIPFGVRSVNLTPWSRTRVVYEVLEPGCLPQELLNRSEVVYNLNHNNNVTNILGRYRNTERDTLKLDLRADGLYNSCDLPNTNAANDTLELIRRGDISGQSFAFEDDDEDTENGVSLERTNETVDGKEVWLRHVKRITGLYDVSIVTHPAYEQTSVGTREQGDEILKQIDAQIERQEREANGGETEKEKAEREQREAEETAQREAEAKAEQERKEREERELEEQAQRARETMMLRLRASRLRTEQEIESLTY